MYSKCAAEAGQSLKANKEWGGKKGRKLGIKLHSGSVRGLGQGRTGNMRPGVVERATWCGCAVDRLHQSKHANDKGT